MAKIVWHEQALAQAHQIYDWYYENASPKVAAKLLQDIIEAPEILITAPECGALEPIFIDSGIPFRYLVVRKTWKVIYLYENDTCYISIIWDTRNNPDKLRSLSPQT